MYFYKEEEEEEKKNQRLVKSGTRTAVLLNLASAATAESGKSNSILKVDPTPPHQHSRQYIFGAGRGEVYA